MKAMIFAAGLGTRLKPLTNSIPKALVKVNERPMLEWTILKLKKSGITKIIVNVHHFADQIINFLNSKNNFGIGLTISHEDELLDTGGGLKKAAWFFEGEKEILVYNADILSDIDLNQLYTQHINNKSDATLCVRNRKTNRYLLFDKNNQLCGWTAKNENEILWVNNVVDPCNEYSFSGIQIISTHLLKHLNPQNKFPIIPEYLRLAIDYKIQSFNTDGNNWIDLGRKENIDSAKYIFGKGYFSDLLV